MTTQATQTSPDILGVSDEDFEKMAEPAAPPPPTPVPEDPPAQAPAQEEPAEPAEEPGESTDPAQAQEPAGGTGGSDPGATSDEPAKPAAPAAPASPPAKPAEEPPAGGGKPAEEPAESVPDYKAFYERIMAPFKANGRTIQLTSADEAVQLMQMGANYTKKVQELGKHRKFVLMLENAGLLDESRLELLIALDKKDPEAIKKFFKDKGLDPVDVDTSSEVKYKPGSHAVSDQEAALAAAIDEVKSMEGGEETIQSVHKSWDSTSKKVLWANPQLLKAIHNQRMSGVYDRVSAEVERRQALGQFSEGTPFLDMYRTVGDELVAKGALQGGTGAAPAAPAPAGPRAPVATRPASRPAAKAPGNPAVRAAAPSRAAPKSATTLPLNVLAMSDDDFLKLKL